MKNYVKYVNPNIGTVGHLLSSTMPTVGYPHGMMKLVPLFRPGVRDIYTSDRIFAFMAGPVLIMPTCRENGFGFEEHASGFDHDMETVSPHYYEVLLEDCSIWSKYTVSRHSGIFGFDFEPDAQGYVMLYLPDYADYDLCEESRTCVVKGKYQRVEAYCRLEFSEGFSAVSGESRIPEYCNLLDGCSARVLRLKLNGSKVFIKLGISFIGHDMAKYNLDNEIPDFNFEYVKERAFEEWNQKLSSIDVETENESHKHIFYTAMYRAIERMVCFSEYGRYLGYDGKVHNDDGYEFYCNDGIWDTYRCMHPLQMIIEPKIHEDILASYIRMYEQTGWLPGFPHREGSMPWMLGNHTAALFADSMAKGMKFDLKTAYEAAKKNALRGSMLPWYLGEATELDEFYFENGYFPAIGEGEEETVKEVHEFEGRQAVSVTLENSYDDWCLAAMAERLGLKEDYEHFLGRSKNYRNLFDGRIKFMAPRDSRGNWIAGFDPKLSGGQGGRRFFSENNSWVYTFSVQHDIEGLIALFGGSGEFAQRLDRLFVEQYGITKYEFLSQFPDATGLIGQYPQGNEPSFHIPYLYNYVSQPWKTQKLVRDIVRLWFSNHPLGICGDDDGGAMSSWFVFAAMGFYPVCPGKPYYDIGGPLFDKCTINLQNGKSFTIEAPGASGKRKYIKGMRLNGRRHSLFKLEHRQLAAGGTMEFDMQERPCYRIDE